LPVLCRLTGAWLGLAEPLVSSITFRLNPLVKRIRSCFPQILSIRTPSLRIRGDVIPNARQAFNVTHDVLVVVALPQPALVRLPTEVDDARAIRSG